MSAAVPHEPVPGFESCGVVAFTTTRDAGSFALAGAEPAAALFARWDALRSWLAPQAPRLVTAHQVHGNRVLVHGGDWEGWLRAGDADGHFAPVPGTAMAVTLADCVPVFLAHPSGAAAVVHSGWRGTVARIVEHGVAAFRRAGLAAGDVRAHLGPAICGRCYVVGADVYTQLTGQTVAGPAAVDLRAIIAGQARAAGVRELSVSAWCTRCHNERFFSHRAGDEGRQLGVIVARGSGHAR